MTTTTHLLRLPRTGGDPLFRLIPTLVQREQAGLATTLDQLVGLRDELGRQHPAGQLSIGSDGVGCRVPGDLSDLRRGEAKVGDNLRGGVRCWGALEPIRQE